jgi:hypothetical protein
LSEITRTAAPDGTPTDRKYVATVREIAHQLLSDTEDDYIFFLGAGASLDRTRPSLPSAATLSQALAEECNLQWHSHVPLSTIAYYYEFFYKRRGLNRFLLDRIDDQKVEPSGTIRHLMKVIGILEDRAASLPAGERKSLLVLTTNYDRHFERAYKETRTNDLGVIVYNGGVDANDRMQALHVGFRGDPRAWGPKLPTYLYKMHGCMSDPGERNLVITEEDYINFLANAQHNDIKKRLLPHVEGRLSGSSIIFIGYGLLDWNFRVLFKATAEQHQKQNYAVQLFDHIKQQAPEEETRWRALVEFWDDKQVDIINADASLFVSDLVEALAKIAGAKAQ